ncbi:hypothetical protein V0288_17370 [Pannus brasiliensis CCIBt3594]|uniref:Glycoside hydrolase family 42 N-terminal domain-containing protein n=1 Tax=Pannus brasiliensis CCIBt3594 TaxID=1427578 RepID=A0AAW9QXI1_9CHRO
MRRFLGFLVLFLLLLGLGTPARADKPFILGWFALIFYGGEGKTYDTTIPARAAAEGYNTLFVYYAQIVSEGTFTGVSADKLDELLENARISGVTLYLEISRDAILSGKNLEGIVSFVRKYKNHPAVGGWYLIDEPELQEVNGEHVLRKNPQYVSDAYRAIQAEDPDHPVIIAFYGRSIRSGINIGPFVNSADLLAVDYYPILIPPYCSNTREFACDLFLSQMYPDLQQMSGLFEREKKPPMFLILQGSGYKKYDQREPTVAETRYYVLTSLQIPTSGVFFFMWELSSPAWRNEVLNPIVAQVKPYLPYLSQRVNTGIKTNNSNLAYQVFRKENEYFMFVTNPNKTSKSTTFTFTGSPFQKVPSTVTCDGKTIPVKRKQFTLNHTKFGANICTF